MKHFTYIVKDSIGLHARPAGLLVKEAKKYQSMITVKKGGKTAGALKMIALMGLGITCGDMIEIEVDGPDEESAATDLQRFFEENL
ncbi:MAG: HPr family phosphocarrier protein [Clostridium sp.]|nr:HPr family phosphocarrier protein [Clostridium sp.]